MNEQPGELQPATSIVDDDPECARSTGLHFSGHEYASAFGPRTVLIRVDPADLVCVPYADDESPRTMSYFQTGSVVSPSPAEKSTSSPSRRR